MPCRRQAHSSTKSAAEYWVPAFAGMTELRMRALFRTVVSCGLHQHEALAFCLSMIFFAKPVPTFADHALG